MQFKYKEVLNPRPAVSLSPGQRTDWRRCGTFLPGDTIRFNPIEALLLAAALCFLLMALLADRYF